MAAARAMTTIRRFTTDDMFQFNNINLDHLTETYNLNFYLQYLAQWPEYFLVHEAPEGRLTSYGEHGTSRSFGHAKVRC